MLLSEYVAAIQARVEREAKPLVAGEAKSFDDYKARAGLIKGLQLSVTILEDLLKQKPAEERNLGAD